MIMTLHSYGECESVVYLDDGCIITRAYNDLFSAGRHFLQEWFACSISAMLRGLCFILKSVSVLLKSDYKFRGQNNLTLAVLRAQFDGKNECLRCLI